MENKNTLPKCWICKDGGMVFYNKTFKNIDYEYAARCKCKLGQEASSSIMTVIEELAEKMAMKNYVEFREIYPESFDPL